VSPRARSIIRGSAVRILAAAACLLAWYITVLPGPSKAERSALAARFAFAAQPVNAASTGASIRPVAPAYQRIRAWISSVGAAVGLFDADGNRRPDDYCLVDPRTNEVTVAPVPGTGSRYAPVVLYPHGLAYSSITAPMGCVPADLNEDGRQDVLVYYWGRSPVVFLGTGVGTPAYLARELVAPAQIWNTNAATLGDFDGDGHVDVVIGNYFPDGARVLDPAAPPGGPEQMTDSLSFAHNGGTSRLYRFVSGEGGAAPAVRFAEAPGVFPSREAHQWTLALGSQDLNGDGLPELYVANDFGPDHLWLNTSRPGAVSFRELRGVRHPTTAKSKALGRDSFKGMGVAFTDLNRDGVADILVSNITQPYGLLESNFAFVSVGVPGQHGATAPYDDHSEPLGLSRSGWSWDIKAADFDADGTDEVVQATGFLRGDVNRWAQLQETAMSNDLIVRHPTLWPNLDVGTDLSGRDHNPLYVRGPDGRYVDIAPDVGMAVDAVSRGIAIGDVDHSGRPDLLLANQWAQSTFYRNRSTANRSLGLQLVLPASCGAVAGASAPTRPAIGASARVTRADGTATTAQVYPANGHGGVNAAELLVGLGAAGPAPVRVDLSWRDACGNRHAAGTSLVPGWHRLLLRPDGSMQGGPA